ncbi:MAG: NADH-quinone oxidoreductase subunit L [Lachnospiraceae bacterium]|nr:NADH-quinone oxidoreductase subunit L [Lachnospiraceae bacterium]
MYLDYAVPFLICFPFLIAVLLLISGKSRIGNAFARIGAVVILITSAAFFVAKLMNGFSVSDRLFTHTEIADHVILGGEILLMAVVVYLCVKYKKYWISLLSIVPTAAIVYLEQTAAAEEIEHIFLDRLAMLMVLLVGIVGSLIIIYAVGYMEGYHNHHKEVQDRRNYFLALLFMFMGAMFGFVTCASLIWLVFFWECTSVCSFLLIGYTRSDEAVNNSFRALWMNLLGGAALVCGIIYFYHTVCPTLSFRTFINIIPQMTPSIGVLALIPVFLMAFAALTKSAQLPFSTWLIGAMVAPTPSSTLLHSATMVKAGIYILIRLAPLMNGNITGTVVGFVGGLTFLAASFMAVAQSDAKKVLAMSTISNLGLMVACAGIGTPETVWACVFLMLFHAVSKSLLFQLVGAVENSLHSRDVEDFHGLLYMLPKHAMFMFIGIAGMFLAPFGMLISKWSALKGMTDADNVLTVIFIVFGSAVTSFYWSKWMGKLIAHPHKTKQVKDVTEFGEMFSFWIHALIMLLLCVAFPFVSGSYVGPMIASDDLMRYVDPALTTGTMFVLVGLLLLVFLIPLILYLTEKNNASTKKPAYMGGINTGDDNGFVDSFGEEKILWVSNYYFEDKLSIEKLMKPCQALAFAALLIIGCLMGAIALSVIGGVM